MPPLHRLIPLALLLLTAPAYAQSSAAEAEHTRLTDEMKRLSSRNAWKGVDDAYRRLEAVAASEGIQLTYRDHYFGASAAREIGDINALYTRLQRALAVERTEEVEGWLADLNQNYGQVRLKFDPKYPGERVLTISEMPFDPAQRRVIEVAQLSLEETRAYDGILPIGAYTFGDQSFKVEAGGGAPVEVALLPKSVIDDGGGGGLSYAGPRVDLGFAYTMAGAPNSADQPGPYSGMGGRVGVGWEIGFSTRVGLLAQVGYHGLFGSAEDATAPAPAAQGEANVAGWTQPAAPYMHLGFGWLAAAYRLGDLRLAAGPVFGVGVQRTWDSGDDGAGQSVSDQDDTGAGNWTGSLRVGGAELGVFYGFLSFGKLQSGLGLHAGAFSDSGRWYPWGQLAFTIAPAAYRRDG